MADALPVTPLHFREDMERPEPDEDKVAAEIVDTMRSIMRTTSTNYGHAVRAVHAKSHALLRGTLRVADGLPFELAQGAFATPGEFPVVMRLSTNPGDILDDDISVPRGMALKIVGVEGERLADAHGTTQDFVMVNGPAFVAPNAAAFLRSLKLLALTTDTPQVFKKLASTTFRGIESLVEAFGGESPSLKSMGGHPNTNPLGDTFYTQVPLLYGPYVAKLSLAPASENLVALRNATIDVSGRPNALRDTMVEHFAAQGGDWELRVQLCTDLDAMPIEDASVIWPETTSPFLTVGRVSVSPQSAWDDGKAKAVDDAMAFSPWHGLAAHRPLGSVMRARKPAYAMSSGFRSEFNGCPIHEPAAASAP